jgi:hypothetical protein
MYAKKSTEGKKSSIFAPDSGKFLNHWTIQVGNNAGK